MIQKQILHNLYLRTILSWVLFIPVPIINGLFREQYLKKVFPDLIAHQLSTAVLSIMFVIYTWFILWDDIKSLATNTLLKIGFIWVLLTLLFEFSFGLGVEKLSMERLLNDYNFTNGRIWIMFLFVMFTAPLLIKKYKVK